MITTLASVSAVAVLRDECGSFAHLEALAALEVAESAALGIVGPPTDAVGVVAVS